MPNYKDLIRRVTILESYIIEGKRDQEILQNFLGDEYYDKFNVVKNKIKDPEYKDVYKIIKKDPEEVKEYIDSIKSNNDKRKSAKEGAELIYSDPNWKVYRVTTYPAAQYYGRGTKWCITGNYEGEEERGQHYFDSYIDDANLDGGYYFYLNNDGKRKFCLLREKDGSIHSIWDAPDRDYTDEEILFIEPEFPKIPGVFIPKKAKINLFVDNSNMLKSAIEKGQDVNERSRAKERDYYGYTPIEWHIKNLNWNNIYILLDAGAKIEDENKLKPVLEYGTATILNNILNHAKYLDKDMLLKGALQWSVVDFVVTLLKHGANPNTKCKSGNTPIYDEVLKGYDARVSLIKALLKYGAQINNDIVELAHSKRCKPAVITALENALNPMPRTRTRIV